jgi:hypothetical protein
MDIEVLSRAELTALAGSWSKARLLARDGDWWRVEGVVLEYDGRKERLEKAKFTGDRSRQNRLAYTGLEIRRFTSYDYYGRPHAAVCADVLRAVALARSRDRTKVLRGPDTLPKPRLSPPRSLAAAAAAA